MARSMDKDGAYDIYIVAHVEELKEKYDELWSRYKEVVHENARLEAENYRLEGIAKGGFR